MSKLELGRVAELAAALTGTESARTAGELGPHWAGTTDNWAKAMDSYGAALVTAAGEYEAREDAARHGFGRMAR